MRVAEARPALVQKSGMSSAERPAHVLADLLRDERAVLQAALCRLDEQLWEAAQRRHEAELRRAAATAVAARSCAQSQTPYVRAVCVARGRAVATK